MTRTLATALCLGFLLTSTHSRAADAPDAVVVLFPFNCADWFQKEYEISGKAWVLGYLTGINELWSATGRKPANPLKVITSNAQVFTWFDAYCKANPFDTVKSAAGKLLYELAERQRGR